MLSLLLGTLVAGVVVTHLETPRLAARLLELAGGGGRAPAAQTATLAWATAAGSLAGVAIIPLFQGDLAFLFRATSWDRGLVWSLLVNLAIFGAIGWLAARGVLLDAWIEREVTPKVPVDLLDLVPLAEFGRRGTEAAAFWLIGSSIASLLFIRYPFSLLHMAILAVTIGLGTAALLRPMVGMRRRIAEAKAAELRAVRDAIRSAQGGDPYPERLPAMLAWEARIAGVNPWPFDVGSALRIGALGLLAIGSWVGGALIERMVEATLG